MAKQESTRPGPGCQMEPDWSRAGFGELSNHIISRHHSFLRRELPELSRLFMSCQPDSSFSKDNLSEASSIFKAVKEKIEAHLRDEEDLLFPLCRKLESGEHVEKPTLDLIARLKEMEIEHGNADRALTRIKELLLDLSGATAREPLLPDLLSHLELLQADLCVHVEKENNYLHPRALALLQEIDRK